MRFILGILTVLALCLSASAAETSVGLDRCAVYNDSEDNSAPSKIGLSFTLPEEIRGKEIIMAELTGNLPFDRKSVGADFALEFYPFTSEWPEDLHDYGSIESITDSLVCGVCAFRIEESSAFYVDITGFMRKAASGERPNFGMIGTARLLARGDVRIPESQGQALRQAVRVRIIYK